MSETSPPGSPMMQAYAAARAAAPDHVVLYRVGEFYEVLGPDAAVVSRLLGLALTRRRQKDGPDVPMCGIPAGSAEVMAARLLAAGRKVALSEQPVEDGGERPLRRMTPGTAVDDAALTPGRPNSIAVALGTTDGVVFASIDLSTGEAGLMTSSAEGCGAALSRIVPTEVVVARWPEGSDALAVALRAAEIPHTVIDGPLPNEAESRNVLAGSYGEVWQRALQGASATERTALAVLLRHVAATAGRLPDAPLPPRRMAAGDTVEIDTPTLRGLEVLDAASGREGALISALDRTVTAAGSRLLLRQLAAPLTSVALIQRRLRMVGYLVADPRLRADCREALSGSPDALRACGRLSMGRGTPRDLAAVRDALRKAAATGALLMAAPDLPPTLAAVGRDLAAASTGPAGELAMSLNRALVPIPPPSGEGEGALVDGYSARLDEARARTTELSSRIDALATRYAAETGVKALRIRVNQAIGWHVEVPAAQAASLGPAFLLRQGLASSTRYSTAELDSLATALEEARERVGLAERAAFEELRKEVLACRADIVRVAHAAAALDLVAGLAQAAAEGLWVEPEVDESADLEIEAGRHPVAERRLEADGRSFVPNDCRMGRGRRLWLLTGPNMAGKSTLLRQVALIVIMAQIGSFVPASRVRVGVVDRVFSRIGAADDLAAGRSTFMVEMLETAAILNGATDRSLVILDEVGRGTSTGDGLAIAQATMEHLHEVGCRCLFSTHYHELADVAEAMADAVPMAMDAAPGREGEAFSYQLVEGRAGGSYGLRVAEMAGVPTSVLQRAHELVRRQAQR